MLLKTIFLGLFLSVQLSLYADASQGEALERKMWEYMRDHKWNDLANKTAPYFQSAFFEGAQNREQFLRVVKTSNIGDFTFSNFETTEAPGILVVTYEVSVSETIGGNPISSKAVRLSVWQKNNNEWQWIAHAVLIPVPLSKADK